MNKLFFILACFFATLKGAAILSYNIYDRTDRVDVMLTFDTPYEGKIVKKRLESKVILKLYEATIESSKTKAISSAFLTRLVLTPFERYTQIVATVPDSDVVLKASKTKDGYGLRLRFIRQTARSDNATRTYDTPSTQTKRLTLPTKSGQDLSTSYYIVVTILIVGIIILLLLKRKIASSSTKRDKPAKRGWLFQAPPTPQKQKTTPQKETSDEVRLLFQKFIDEKNKVVLLAYREQSYLLVLGEHNNILLDKFSDGVPASQSEFEALLQEKNEQLAEFLQVAHTSQEQTPQDSLKAFSKKASHIPFEDNF